MYKEDIPSYEDAMRRCLEFKEKYQCTYRIKRRNGEIRWIDSRGNFNKEGTAVIGTIQDITENKQLEIEKKQQDEILYQQSKMAAMGEMLGNIAHQWRQPLSTISTAATGAKLQKEMNCLSDEQLNSSLTTINESAQYLSRTIDDFRGFFNPSNTKEVEFKIADTINKALNLVSSQFVSKEIDIIQNIENLKLISLENELIQVLVNVLNNSRDILIKGDTQKRLIFINTYRKEKLMYIEILDNGGGIDKKIINKIFEPYFTTKHQSQGTGIGLYMSQDIIKNHLKGDIIATNESYTYDNIEYKCAKFTISILLND
jgi:C4-dicarboxylate-specific signal transduction histidine kinase